jgi:MFS superfamily sulfate permease-like transporter
MGIEFIYRTIKTSLILALIILLFVSVYYNFKFALGILVGCMWGCLNLYFLSSLIVETIKLEKINRRKVLLIVLVKFPLLYFLGYILLRIKYFSALSLLAGFTLIFVVLALKALGRIILHLDDKKKKEVTPSSNS